jgi:hypothetical protein
MLAIVGSFSVLVSIESFRGSTFRNDRDIIVAALEKARSQAVNNMCLGAACTGGVSHGVDIDIAAGTYTIFQGASYLARDAAYDEVIPARAGGIILGAGSVTDVVFTPLSGNTTSGTVSLIDVTGRTSTISLDGEGRIAWTN